MTAYLRPARLEDAALLAPILREDDLRELAASSGNDPKDAIEHGITNGSAWTMCDEDGPFGIFGVTPHEQLEGVGVCWMVSSERIHKHATKFLRENRKVFSVLHEQWPILTNFVDARNTVHLRWLQWMGFVFLQLHPEYGVGKMPFYEIVKVSSHV